VFCRRTGWLQVDLCAGLERRPERTDRTKAVADTSLERLFRREDVPVREKCLWRLLYETAARAQEVLSLNVEDLDLDNKRARTVSKGGDTEWLHFQSGSARLLPRVIAGRQTGPLFLADRRPAPARTPAAVDVCPVTGRGRLSYERAEYLFKRHSRRISRNGLTLHQLRHSALTTLADANVSLPLLMGKSRHKSLRSLQRYVHPSAEAVAAMTAPTTPPPGVVGTDTQQDHRGLGLVTAFLPAPRDGTRPHPRTHRRRPGRRPRPRPPRRPPLRSGRRHPRHRHRRARGESVTAIARHLGLGRSTLYRALGEPHPT